MSKIRRAYMLRLTGRWVVLALCALTVAFAPEQLEVLEEGKFFQRLSWLHLLWVCWVLDMLQQLVPVKGGRLVLGSQKLFSHRFQATNGYDRQGLRAYIRAAGRRAYQIFALWAVLTAVCAYLYIKGVASEAALFMVSVAFYVCDLICVLIWCPFRLFLGNRCCTTCRIFNWDHLMMFTPMIAMTGFFSRSLLVLAVLTWGLWEFHILFHPERFWERSNGALRCGACTDKLCTQYCQRDKAFRW